MNEYKKKENKRKTIIHHVEWNNARMGMCPCVQMGKKNEDRKRERESELN